MRVSQTPFRSNRKVAEDEDDGGEDDGESLEGNVYSEGEVGVSVVEAGCQDGGGNDCEECYGSDDSMGGNERVIFRKGTKSVAHACRLLSVHLLEDEVSIDEPLNRIAANGNPSTLGSKKSSRPSSQVPSPTWRILEE